METKFKADPYNFSNFLIQENDILNIMKSLNIQDFKINNLSFYQQAFVHKSYTELKDYEEYEQPNNCLPLCKLSYETMEFLGDSFLGNIIANYLYQRYVNYFNIDEGFLTKLKIRFVCGEQLAFLSKQLGFDKFIILSKHIEENCDGRNNIHILEDVNHFFIDAPATTSAVTYKTYFFGNTSIWFGGRSAGEVSRTNAIAIELANGIA